MDDLPPPPPDYESATARDWLIPCAEYIYPEDLVNASRVSKKWNVVFTPELWGEPDRIWSNEEWTEEQRIRSFLSFLDSIVKCRGTCCMAVHSIDLRTVALAIQDWGTHYDIPDDWMVRIFFCLPNLTTFIGIRSLQAPLASIQALTSPHQNLQSLIIPRLEISHKPLDILLSNVPRLRILNLNGIKAASSEGICITIGSKIPNLNELHLSGTDLTDSGLQLIVRKLGTKLDTLDISRNKITDVSVKTLLDYCFLPPDYGSSTQFGAGPPGYSSHAFRGARTGLTTLALSQNWKLSPIVIDQLLRTSRLTSLDAGTLNFPSKQFFPSHIIPALLESPALRHLRIDFRIICARPDPTTKTILRPTFPISSLPWLTSLTLEGIPYYLPTDYSFPEQLRALFNNLQLGETALANLFLEIAQDEDSSYVPEDGVSIYPRFPEWAQSSPRPTPLQSRQNTFTGSPSSSNEDDDDNDDGGWAGVTDYGSGESILDDYAERDFSFFNEPRNKLGHEKEPPRRPSGDQGHIGTLPLSPTSTFTMPTKKELKGLIDVKREVDRVIRYVGKSWRGKIRFGKADENERWGAEGFVRD